MVNILRKFYLSTNWLVRDSKVINLPVVLLNLQAPPGTSSFQENWYLEMEEVPD